MPYLNLLFLLCLFVLVGAVSYWLMSQWRPAGLEMRRRRLLGETPSSWRQWSRGIAHRLWVLLQWLSPWAAGRAPSENAMAQRLHLQLLNAGFRTPTAEVIYFGSKTLLTLLMPLVFWGASWLSGAAPDPQVLWAGLLMAAALGYYLPNLVLHQLVLRQQKILFHAIPDALDLLRLCVQAGLGLDAALERVGREMRWSCPELSDELGLTGLELRAGASRAESLRHLAQRMGVPDVDGLVSMLIQSDRFGTSMADSLQVHSDALRSKRRLLAEEAAAKLPIKLLVPLIFCVFPALMTVLLGPVVISISKHLFPLVNA
jgi:tight adherence protein C